MKILLLAPQPFYENRGTPIAVDLLLQVLSKQGYEVDLLTYPEGSERPYPRVYHKRIFNNPLTRNMRPGFSLKKLINDFFMGFRAVGLVARKKYDLIHAVEESVYMALFLSLITGTPYLYDMDSSLAEQLIEKMPSLRFFYPLFSLMEGMAIRYSAGVLAVCDSLAAIAKRYQPKRLQVLNDISFLDQYTPSGDIPDLRRLFGISGKIFMYIGNLEKYQGIDLMLDSFARIAPENREDHLVVIGGLTEDIGFYSLKCENLGISGQVHFMGPRPLSDMKAYTDQADILLSPRIKGKNSPMKIYSYLHSGKPVLATLIESHTQVLNENNSCLANPDPQSFGAAMLRLVRERELREKLGLKGKSLVEEKYCFPVFQRKLLQFYKEVMDEKNRQELEWQEPESSREN